MRTGKSARLALVVIAVGAATVAQAQPQVGYAQASGYFKQSTRPTLYQPLNLLDAREATVWCSPTADTLSEWLVFGFKGVARVDEIRIYTGNGADDTSFHEFSRARKFTVTGPTNGRSFSVADQRGLQAFAINPPLEGSYLTVEIVDQYPAEDPETPVCVTDIVFYQDGKALNGPWMTQRLKYNRARAQLLGTWFAGYDGAPDRYLAFFFDGTWRFTYEPFEGKRRAYGGTYTVSGTRVVLDLPGGRGRAVGHLVHEREASEDDPLAPKAKRTLSFDGANLPEDFKKVYRDVK